MRILTPPANPASGSKGAFERIARGIAVVHNGVIENHRALKEQPGALKRRL